MIGYGSPSTTERMLVNNDGLINPSLLKIQSAPLRKFGDQAFDKLCQKQEAWKGWNLLVTTFEKGCTKHCYTIAAKILAQPLLKVDGETSWSGKPLRALTTTFYEKL